MKTKDLSNETRYCSGVQVRMHEENGEKKQIVRGYAAKFGVLSEFMYGTRERILVGAFDDVLNDDVRALINHEGIPLARSRGGQGTLSLGIDETGLWYEFEAPDTEEARTLVAALDRGDIDQSSFRFSVSRQGYDYVDTEADGVVREISKISSLRDVSVVTFPAYPDASAEMKRSFDEYKSQSEADPDFLKVVKLRSEHHKRLAN